MRRRKQQGLRFITMCFTGALATQAMAQASDPKEPPAEGAVEARAVSTEAGVSGGEALLDQSDRDAASDDTSNLESAELSTNYPQVQVGARVIAGALITRTRPSAGQADVDSRQPFVLQQARLKLRAQFSKQVRLVLSGDLEARRPVRSAFISVRLDRALRLRVGRFKRPISRLELTSVGELPFTDRGLFNAALIEDAGWGDRSLGVQVSGKFKVPKLRYYLALMNGSESLGLSELEQLRGADVLGRVEYKPWRGLTVALNGGHKWLEPRQEGALQQLWALGGDVRFKTEVLELVLESIAAQNPYPPAPPTTFAPRSPWAWTVNGYGSYRYPLGGPWVLQGVVAAEWVDTDLDVSQDETLRLLAGVNVLYTERLRLMPRFEIHRPLGGEGLRSTPPAEIFAVIVSLAL